MSNSGTGSGLSESESSSQTSSLDVQLVMGKHCGEGLTLSTRQQAEQRDHQSQRIGMDSPIHTGVDADPHCILETDWPRSRLFV